MTASTVTVSLQFFLGLAAFAAVGFTALVFLIFDLGPPDEPEIPDWLKGGPR